ncbi:MAG TPA: DNA methylase, partial [Flavisolibacter sp.]|nr:DNA methylase [Flavisolibacter sp.]
IPVTKIKDGEKTNEPIRTRGWTYWHQLFNPRQLLINGLFLEKVNELAKNNVQKVVSLLAINGLANRNSKLMIWNYAYDKSEQTFANQALNTLFNFPVRAMSSIYSCWKFDLRSKDFSCNSQVQLKDARTIDTKCDIWITDPPYADAVNYHELSEFFLAWNKGLIDIFPDWYIDSKRILAVRGSGETFNSSMVDIYSNLAKYMPDNGLQVVMFTHQDVSVWADLTSILWSAGLRVTAAWNIATETESGGLKDGNYVKGTVLLVLRKQTSEDTAYLDELYPEVENEVKRQIDSMRELDDKEDPNFTDADYLLAAYAASLKVLTAYKNIEDIDVNYELTKKREAGEVSPIEQILNEAIKIAYDYLTPAGFDSFTWKMLIPEERYYIKGLDFEKENIYQLGAYQEIARGFGVKEYKALLASSKANNTRLKTAKEFAMRGISDADKFGSSLLRNVLAALYQSIKAEDTSKGLNWLKNEVPNYWNQRNTIVVLLDFIATLVHHEHMKHWEDEAKYARLLSELVKNDGV